MDCRIVVYHVQWVDLTTIHSFSLPENTECPKADRTYGDFPIASWNTSKVPLYDWMFYTVREPYNHRCSHTLLCITTYVLPFDIGYIRITSIHRAEQHQNGAFISDIDGFNLHSILDASHRGPKFDRRQTHATIGKKRVMWDITRGMALWGSKRLQCKEDTCNSWPVYHWHKKIEKLVPAVQAVYFGMRGT